MDLLYAVASRTVPTVGLPVYYLPYQRIQEYLGSEKVANMSFSRDMSLVLEGLPFPILKWVK